MGIALTAAVLGLVVAAILIAKILRSPAGNDRMQAIAKAIQEGARAYLNRQITTICLISVVIFILLAILQTCRPRSDSSSAQHARSRQATSACASPCWPMYAPPRCDHEPAKGVAGGLQRRCGNGLLVVALALLSVGIFWFVMSRINPQARSRASSAWRSVPHSSRFLPVSAAVFIRRPPMSVPTSSARWSPISMRTIRVIPRPSRTMWR